VQEAATFGAGPVSVGVEAIAGALKHAAVDLGRNPAERGYILLRQVGIQPGLLERAALELDVQAVGIAARDLGREQGPVVGQAGTRSTSLPDADRLATSITRRMWRRATPWNHDRRAVLKDPRRESGGIFRTPVVQGHRADAAGTGADLFSGK
jgi:hypothetical protein